MTEHARLLSSLSTSFEAFLQPSSSLHSETIASVKALLDPLAANVADAQKSRRDENRKKRKRGDVEREDEALQLRQVYTNGLGVKQVWEQARRILDAACAEVERDVAAWTTRMQADDGVPESTADHTTEDDEDLEASLNEEDMLMDDSIEDPMSGNELLGEDDLDEEDIEDVETEDSAVESEEQDPGVFIQDPNKLNDGFFSIDDFNRQTQFLEQQDARGEDDNPTDEDEIDWDADPLTMVYHRPRANADGQRKNEDPLDDGNESDDEDGPTFGNADLNAGSSDEDVMDQETDNLDDGNPGLDNTNDIRYADFFAPPPKKLSKTRRMRALPKTQPTPQPHEQDEEELENDLQRAISNVRRDLLDSEEEDDGLDLESGSDMDASKPSAKNMSTHEKQRAAIAAEIRRLEASNVTKRDWTLSGEARAADRPLNSLIEEDLEFERVGKPVPIITSEVSEEIEALIKRRILAKEFDEVIRRRPDAIGSANDTRRGRIELDDTRPQAGLAEVYEQDHLRATDPGYVDKRSAATKKQHEEISRLWKEVSSQLDLLSNLHFKPKRVEAEIKSVEDKPTISMEDARPVGMGVHGEESMLAPQEVYRPGEEREKRNRGEAGDVVVRKGGASVNKDEMTREEKLRRRRREKERAKKARGNAAASASTLAPGTDAARAGDGNPKKSKLKGQEKADIISDLRKGNVKVIGKKGELEDLPGGKKAKSANDERSAVAGGALKL